MKLKPHFITALLSATSHRHKSVYVCMLLLVPLISPSHAQPTHPSSGAHALCSQVWGLSPTVISPLYQETGLLWFSATAELSTKSNHSKQPRSLSINSTNTERTLLSRNDRILTHWSTTENKQADYLIVRPSWPIKDFNGRTLGHFVHVLGMARTDTTHKIDHPLNSSQPHTAAVLRILRADQDILTTDQLIPQPCLEQQPTQATLTPPTSPIDTAEPTSKAQVPSARILGFADSTQLGAPQQIALMDQGRLHGVHHGQRWHLISPHQATSDRTMRAVHLIQPAHEHIQILNIHEHYTIVRILNGQREIQRGSQFRTTEATSQPTPTPHPAHTP